MEMMLDKKQIRVIFLYLSSKWSVKQQRQLTMSIAQEFLTNSTVQWWFKKLCKGNESLEDEGHGGWHPRLTMTN